MLSVAFVLPYGEPSDGFFPDTMLALLCAEARELGHRGEMVRVYYDGRDAERDRQVGDLLERWLDERAADLVVVERLFDPAPLLAHARRDESRSSLLVTRGDSFDPIDGVDLVIGATPGSTRSGGTRRTPNVGELVLAFRRLLEAVAADGDPISVPGVARVTPDGLVGGRPLEAAPLKRPFTPVVEHDVLCLVDPPRVERKTLFGNSGCPYAADPLDNPWYSGVELPRSLPVARLGCAFCCMGGDYQKRSNEEVVDELVEQARFFADKTPEVRELVLNDQHSLRYLASLVKSAHAAGVPPRRWLFAARADSFVRESERVRAAVHAAAEVGHVLEVYLSGFEAFCDRELRRYNKGVEVADLLSAVTTMRQLAATHPESFAYSRARGHSLILYNPWTSPEDLLESAEAIRANGLQELFDELGRNRLRLYRDLPIYYAAERDGAITDVWETGDEGAGRRKGYNVERPWRFLDARTRLAYETARVLRERLGAETEVAQLRAAALLAMEPGEPSSTAATVDHDVEHLRDLLHSMSSGKRPTGAPRALKERGSVVLFGGPCNNGCAACPNRDRWLDDRDAALDARIDAARSREGPIVFAGREPTMHRSFVEALARARGEEGRPVGVVSNGRRFCHAPFARSALRAGLRAASIKVFAPTASVADVISRDPGGYDQALEGIGVLRAGGLDALEVRAPLHRDNLAEYADYAALAAKLAASLRIDAALDAIGLDRLSEACAAVEELARRCASEGVALEVSPLEASTRHFEWLPLPPRELRS